MLFVLYLRTSSLTQSQKDFFLYFKSFIFRSVIYFELIFHKVENLNQSSFMAYRYPIIPVPFVKKTTLFFKEFATPPLSKNNLSCMCRPIYECLVI